MAIKPDSLKSDRKPMIGIPIPEATLVRNLAAGITMLCIAGVSLSDTESTTPFAVAALIAFAIDVIFSISIRRNLQKVRAMEDAERLELIRLRSQIPGDLTSHSLLMSRHAESAYEAAYGVRRMGSDDESPGE